MKRNLLISVVFIFTALLASAQRSLPIIKAISNKVSIKDGAKLNKNCWTISPAIKPDVHKTSNKRVTFYTDIDSITFNVKPDKIYNFIILLNNKDSAYTQIRFVPTYLDILKKADKYNYSDNREILKFTYTPRDNPDLIALRQRFNLDSIVGTGNEISKILSLLHWVHNTFPHDGSKEVPSYSTTVDLMSKCIVQHGTMHCGALADVLNDCYLSLGFKSRRVICLPKDSTDFDCHSINSVYSNTLNKWLWIDPTNDAYVMNEQGILLSIAEVRSYLINDKPLILNPEANWNHRSSVTKEYYLFNYMAKNLYAILCMIQTNGEYRSNMLLPIEYKGLIPRAKANRPKCTNNPGLFWAKPE